MIQSFVTSLSTREIFFHGGNFLRGNVVIFGQYVMIDVYYKVTSGATAGWRMGGGDSTEGVNRNGNRMR